MLKPKLIEETKDRPVPTFDEIRENNPSGYILRGNLKQATGGLLDGRTMANLDCKGEGISECIEFGRKRAYPVEAVIKFLQEKVVIRYRDHRKQNR